MEKNARDIEFRQLRYFVALAEELHFGQAALRLQIAQPSLSRQIQLLERQLGAPLFRRTQRQVQLTPVGQVFLEQAKRTLEQHERALEIARNTVHQSMDVLTIGFEPCAAFHGLPEIVQQFAAHHPDIRLITHQLTAPEQEEAVRRGRIDAGFLHPPVGDPNLAFEKVMEESFLAALPSVHPLAGRRKIALGDLALEVFIFFPREVAPACFDITYRLCSEAGFVPNVQHRTSDLNFCLALVSSGAGVTIAPACARERRIRGVAYRELNKATPRVESGFVRRPGSISPALELLVKLWRSYAGNGR
ncbi:LysR family transcriptional regulator [Gloeobacter morelensis]|uniref:LysR family transcriptional regulator n=1 Tax=Gloeobacter morelensis MG652769 TaxID=2781736 RepID=A0ABY3PRK3_9CYAN|nr:LysR family transcriptional regulator [Gloeobacter morelensis]UFP96235.1 LysR family transcriptional regulator [Gloeobacter morelensis MG652769]